ncbi:MAG: hypothetical protein GY816_07090 [Cytophagales bacterium]|nr:hypothetical protein [Cytophagales bacterium]
MEDEKRPKGKKKRLECKMLEGWPLSLEAITGSNTFDPWPLRQSGKKTEAVLRNEVELPGIVNIPGNFHWTDVPIVPAKRPDFEGVPHLPLLLQW